MERKREQELSVLEVLRLHREFHLPHPVPADEQEKPLDTVQRTGTLGQFVPKYSGFGELPNKHFCGSCALQKFRSVATPELLAKTRNPQHGAKKRRLRLICTQNSGHMKN